MPFVAYCPTGRWCEGGKGGDGATVEGKASSGALGPRHTIVRARVGRRSKANDDGEALRELRSGVEAVEDPVDRDAGGAVPIPLRLSRLNLQPLRWSSQLTSN